MKFDLLDEIKLFLPKYLSDDQLSDILKNLHKQYGHISTKAMYSPTLEHSDKIFQGDGIRDLLVINLPNDVIARKPCMVVSNSCDNSSENERLFDASVSYCPIFNLEKYSKMLLGNGESKDSVASHIDAIRKQQVTQIFYLPAGDKGDKLESESFIFFDKIVSCNGADIEKDKLKELRLFRLSNAGFYLFLLKLSIHFTRVQERIDRDKNGPAQ